LFIAIVLIAIAVPVNRERCS